jgi:flavodoxin
MGKILIAYLSWSGTTQQMAAFIAEGVRIAGHEAEVRKIGDIKSEKDLSGFDGYVFGCPTDHLDMPEAFRTFLSLAGKDDLKGKVGGAFSSRSHPSSSGTAAAHSVFKAMESEMKVRMTNLGAFNLDGESSFNPQEKTVEGPEGRRACQDYGRSISEML